MKWFKSRDQKIKEVVQEVTKGKAITTQDRDLARLEKMSQMVSRMQSSQPQQSTNNFMQQMMQFEAFKNGMMQLEEAKVEKLREKFESEMGDSDEGMKPEQIMGILGNFMQQKPKENDPFAPTRVVTIPPAPQFDSGERLPETIEAPLPELNPLEKGAVTLAVKKIPSKAKAAFKTLSEDKREAVITAILDKIEQE